MKSVKVGLAVLMIALAGCQQAQPPQPPPMSSDYLKDRIAECSANNWQTSIWKQSNECETIGRVLITLYLQEHPQLIGVRP